MNKYINIKTNWLLFFIGLFLFAYIVIRAWLLSFTFDESTTYLEYVRKGYVGLKDYNVHGTNNHLLNTWLMELSVKAFGICEFTLRLPNVLFHLLYLVYSAKLFRNLSSKAMVIGAFLILNLNPFLLEFFSLARGYGMSMALMMTSLYFAYKFIEGKGNYLSAFFSILFATIAVLAYFILINFLLILSALLLFVNLINILEDKNLKSIKKVYDIIRKSIFIILPLSALFYIIPALLRLKKEGSMDFGVSNGFWSNTVRSLGLDMFWYLPKLDDVVFIFQLFVGLVLIVSFILIIRHSIQNISSVKSSFMSFIFCIMMLCFLASFIQHQRMNILYPSGRYALNYFLMFVLLLVFLFEYLNRTFGIIYKKIFAMIALFFVVNFLVAFNLKYTHDWHSEADTKAMIEYLIKNKKQLSKEKNNLTIGAGFQMNSDINFYRAIYHLDWLNKTSTVTSWYPINDYFYLERLDTGNLPSIKHRVLKEYSASNTLLISNEENYSVKEIYADKNDFENTERNKGYPSFSSEHPYSGKVCVRIYEKWSYSPAIQYKIDDTLLHHKNAIVSVKAMVYANSLHTDCLLVISHQSTEKIKNYFTCSIEDFIQEPKKWTPVYFTALVPDDVLKGETIGFYFWNIGHHDVYIDDMEFKIIGYEK